MEKGRPRITLRDAWTEAEKQFYEITKERLLMANRDGKAGVLQVWEEKYKKNEDGDSKKHQKIAGILDNVLNGIELVSAFASQAASLVYPPAGMCFNAVSFLLNAPKEIQKVYDTLQDLFQTIQSFLVKFKIYQRIDDAFGLDEDLIANTNNLLMSFVQICALATKLLRGGFRQSLGTALSAVFLRNDRGVSTELANFEKLVVEQSTLTQTVTVEQVMQSKDMQKQILKDTRQIAQDSEEIKYGIANMDRLTAIESRLFRSGVPAIMTPISHSDEGKILDGTLETLEAEDTYSNWYRSVQRGVSILVLTGGLGSGRSVLVRAIKSKVDAIRATATRNDPSTYIATHEFPVAQKSKLGDGRSRSSDIPIALKTMALQMARKSTTYAVALQLAVYKVRDLDQETDIERLWKLFKFSTFEAPQNANVFLVFDGIDRDVDVTILLRVLAKAKSKERATSFRVKVLFTADGTDNNDKWPNLETLSWPSINFKLHTQFIASEMERLDIFQDRSDRNAGYRSTVRSHLTMMTMSGQFGGFPALRTKLTNVRLAVDSDRATDELEDILDEETDDPILREGQKTLAMLESSLDPKNIMVLNKLLAWVLCSPQELSVTELEAILVFETDHSPLESLKRRIASRFSSVLKVVGPQDHVQVLSHVEAVLRQVGKMSKASVSKEQRRLEMMNRRSEMMMDRGDIDTDEEAALREMTETSEVSVSAVDSEPRITMDIKMNMATMTVARQFVWNLHERLSTDLKDFFADADRDPKIPIQFDEIKARVGVVRSILRLFEKVEHAQPGTRFDFLSHACSCLPQHIKRLMKPGVFVSVSMDDRKIIGRGLINFFSNLEPMKKHRKDYGPGDWLNDEDCIKSMTRWLVEKSVFEQLSVMEQRWVKSDAELRDDYGLLVEIACSVGWRWLGKYNPRKNDLAPWLCRFVHMVTKIPEDFVCPYIYATSDLTVDDESDLYSDRAAGSTRNKTHEERALVIRKARDFVERHCDVKVDDCYHVTIGDTYFFAGMYREALNSYQSASNHPDFKFWILFGEARAYFHLGDLAQAMIKADAANAFKGSSLEDTQLGRGLVKSAHIVAMIPSSTSS